MKVWQRNTVIAIAVLIGFLALTGVVSKARAQTVVPLSSCLSWSINDGVFRCMPVTGPIAPPVVVTPPSSGDLCAPRTPLNVSVPWPRSGTSSPRQVVGGFGNDAVLVARFTTGTKAGIGRLSVSEFGAGPAMRTVSLSTVPCGFGPAALTTKFGNGATLYFSIGPNPYGYTPLQPSTTYYFNVRNTDADGAPSCVSGSCDVGFDLLAP